MSLRDAIQAAGFSSADQERCATYFQPGSQRCNLSDIEAAQRGYWELRGMLERTMDFDEWLRCRPRHAKPSDYASSVGVVEVGARELVAAFGVAVVARPTIQEQRQCPN